MKDFNEASGQKSGEGCGQQMPEGMGKYHGQEQTQGDKGENVEENLLQHDGIPVMEGSGKLKAGGEIRHGGPDLGGD